MALKLIINFYGCEQGLNNLKEMNYSCFLEQLESVIMPRKNPYVQSVSDPEKYLLKYKLGKTFSCIK